MRFFILWKKLLMTHKFWIKKNVTSHLKHILCYTLNNIIISMFAISSSSTIQCQIQANQHACSSRCACAGRRGYVFLVLVLMTTIDDDESTWLFTLELKFWTRFTSQNECSVNRTYYRLSLHARI